MLAALLGLAGSAGLGFAPAIPGAAQARGGTVVDAVRASVNRQAILDSDVRQAAWYSRLVAALHRRGARAPDGLAAAIDGLIGAGAGAEELRAWLERAPGMPASTAHTTEARRRPTLDHLSRIRAPLGEADILVVAPYNAPGTGPLAEDAPTIPSDLYGRHKLAAEQRKQMAEEDPVSAKRAERKARKAQLKAEARVKPELDHEILGQAVEVVHRHHRPHRVRRHAPRPVRGDRPEAVATPAHP